MIDTRESGRIDAMLSAEQMQTSRGVLSCFYSAVPWVLNRSLETSRILRSAQCLFKGFHFLHDDVKGFLLLSFLAGASSSRTSQKCPYCLLNVMSNQYNLNSFFRAFLLNNKPTITFWLVFWCELWCSQSDRRLTHLKQYQPPLFSSSTFLPALEKSLPFSTIWHYTCKLFRRHKTGLLVRVTSGVGGRKTEKTWCFTRRVPTRVWKCLGLIFHVRQTCRTLICFINDIKVQRFTADSDEPSLVSSVFNLCIWYMGHWTELLQNAFRSAKISSIET